MLPLNNFGLKNPKAAAWDKNNGSCSHLLRSRTSFVGAVKRFLVWFFCLIWLRWSFWVSGNLGFVICLEFHFVGCLGCFVFICSFFWCGVKFIPTLMWGGTSSFGSCEAEAHVLYTNGCLLYFSCPFDFLVWVAFLESFRLRFLSEDNLREYSGLCFKVFGRSFSCLWTCEVCLVWWFRWKTSLHVLWVVLSPLEVGNALSSLRGLVLIVSIFGKYLWLNLCSWLSRHQLVKLWGLQVVQSIGLKPTDFPDYLIKVRGALAQLRAIFE